ncbi:MAG: glycoside hydrolase family 127 protein [Clostridia bacterium]|nr:glycoside hydrolase family 127 protein [Clostridia bacterium]
MKKVPFYDLTVTDGFWAERQQTVLDKTIWAVYDRFEETGRNATMDCKDHGIKPHIFWGSDVVKWMEGAAYILKQHPDEKLWNLVDALITTIENSTTEDGYYNSYFNSPHAERPRFSNRDKHELYSLGHMMEAAVALHDIGDDRLMEVCRKNAELVQKIFVEEQSAAFVTPGHQEIELALYRMYKITGDKLYLDLATFFIDRRGIEAKDAEHTVFTKEQDYCQSHLPVREQETAEGHSVRALYMYCGMADLAEELDDDGLRKAVRALFDDMYQKKMYITGGYGSQKMGERFTLPYHLPNREAYTETCAALAMVLFGARLYRTELDGKYGDAVERALYNGMISGLSLSGDAFFYSNPLEIDKERVGIPQGYNPKTVRQKVFGCSCCPPNITRIVPSIAEYVYTYDAERLYVHQYIATEGKVDDTTVQMRTLYPADGKVQITCPDKKLTLRLPYWCDEIICDAPYTEEKGYLYFDTDTLTIEFVMKPVFYTASHRVHEDIGRVALMRGPIVYCIEGQDQQAPLFRLRVDADAPVTTLTETYGGYPLLETTGVVTAEQPALYAPYIPTATEPTTLRFIPYYAFANRGEDDMQVWVMKK